MNFCMPMRFFASSFSDDGKPLDKNGQPIDDDTNNEKVWVNPDSFVLCSPHPNGGTLACFNGAQMHLLGVEPEEFSAFIQSCRVYGDVNRAEWQKEARSEYRRQADGMRPPLLIAKHMPKTRH